MNKNVITHCLLPTAHCPLPIAYCLLPTAYCLLPIAYCLLPTAYLQLLSPAILPFTQIASIALTQTIFTISVTELPI